MPRVFIYVALVSVLTCDAHAEELMRDQRIGKQYQSNDSFELPIREQLFRKSFSSRRKEHEEAIKRLQKIESYENLYKMLTILGEKMIDVIDTSALLIKNSDFDPNNRTLPENATVQSAMSTILENTLLFGEIVLHFPHVMHRILKAERSWNTTMSWSLNFTNRASHFLDEKTVALVRLAEQELDVTKREPGYSNPYWSPSKPEETKETKKRKSTKKEKRKRGPQITNIEL